MMWHRHQGDSRWHTGAPSSGSYLTLCNGRWPLTDAAHGLVERSANPPEHERCGLCVCRSAAVEAERTEVHMLVDYLLTVAANDRDGMPPLMGEAVAKFARELRRLRQELEERTNELQLVERELADLQSFEGREPLGGREHRLGSNPTRSTDDDAKLVGALIEAIGIAQAAGRRGLLSTREHERLRELAKVVPQ